MRSEQLPRDIQFIMPTLKSAEDTKQRCEANGYLMEKITGNDIDGYEVRGTLRPNASVYRMNRIMKRRR